ncbi:hypothetical protein EV360DRAFT_90852 [Lentinula raphanica]|nr:hypothetical protein EV360DRAFT_90852 [Lentinula raphanica]
MSRRKLIDNGLRTWDRSSEYANFRTNIHNNTFDKLSSMDPFYEAIFVGLLGTCIFALLFGAFVITGNIAAFAWIQIPRYVSELLARVLAPWAKAEELKRREEQIRLREMELDQLQLEHMRWRTRGSCLQIQQRKTDLKRFDTDWQFLVMPYVQQVDDQRSIVRPPCLALQT